MNKAIVAKRKIPQMIVISDIDSGRQSRITLHHDHSLQSIIAMINGAKLPVDRIILYGSCARGTMKYQSDVDLLCVIKRPLNEKEISTARKIRSKGMSLEPEADLQFFQSTSVEQSNNVYFQEVRKDGLTIWKS